MNRIKEKIFLFWVAVKCLCVFMTDKDIIRQSKYDYNGGEE